MYNLPLHVGGGRWCQVCKEEGTAVFLQTCCRILFFYILGPKMSWFHHISVDSEVSNVKSVDGTGGVWLGQWVGGLDYLTLLPLPMFGLHLIPLKRKCFVPSWIFLHSYNWYEFARLYFSSRRFWGCGIFSVLLEIPSVTQLGVECLFWDSGPRHTRTGVDGALVSMGKFGWMTLCPMLYDSMPHLHLTHLLCLAHIVIVINFISHVCKHTICKYTKNLICQQLYKKK